MPLFLNDTFDGHIDEETLELYVLRRLPGQLSGQEDTAELAHLEEHLLWCRQCLDGAKRLQGLLDKMVPVLSAAMLETSGGK
jgi:hypothetical protein